MWLLFESLAKDFTPINSPYIKANIVKHAPTSSEKEQPKKMNNHSGLLVLTMSTNALDFFSLELNPSNDED